MGLLLDLGTYLELRSLRDDQLIEWIDKASCRQAIMDLTEFGATYHFLMPSESFFTLLERARTMQSCKSNDAKLQQNKVLSE